MGPRFIFATLVLAFGFAVLFATLTTMRHVNAYDYSLRIAQRG
jgi:hypothetical protein